MTVLTHANFRNLFLGQAASSIGDRIVFVALALYVTDIGTPSDVGLVLAAHALPLVAFVLIGGVWADRLPRTKVMISTDLIRFALHATLAALIFTGAVEIWHIVVIEIVFGTADAFFKPALTGLVPQTVPEDQIQPARAATAALENVAEFVGPALATALVLGLGAGWAFALDALTFLVSAAFLLRVRARDRGGPVAEQRVIEDLREGWAAFRSRAWVWSVVLAFSVALLLTWAPWTTLGATVAEQSYDSTGVFGVLAAALGAGTMVGAVIGFRWRPLHPMRMGVVLTLAWPAATLGFAVMLPLPLVVAGFVCAGVGLSLFDIWWHTALAERVPPHLLSRVSAYDWMGSLALVPLGYLIAGPLGEALGGREVLTVGAALSVGVLGSALVVRETWTLRRREPEAAAV
jgi:MFS family permease